MQFQEPYKIWNINVDNLVYKNQKETKDKKIIFIKYEEDSTFKNMVFQLPTLNNSFNLNDNEIEININTDDEGKGNKIVDFLNLIDLKVIKDAKINANSWFNHIKDKTKINYHHLLKPATDSNHLLKLKIIDSKDFKTNLILNNNYENKLDIYNLPNDGKIKLVLEFYAIWVHDNNFGILLRPIIISFIDDQENDYNYKILEDSDSDNDEDLFIKSTDNRKINLNLIETITQYNRDLKQSDSQNSQEDLDSKKLDNSDSLNNSDDSSQTSDIDENNLNNLIFNFKNLKI